MVLNHHLLYLCMTLITFQDGKPVMRDGKVGTEQACCCGCDPCLLRLCTAYGICITEPAGNEQEVCDEFAAQFLWLKEAIESVGWTVTISEWPTEEIPQPGCDDPEQGLLGYQCRQKIVATCSVCDVYGPNDGEWLDLEAYAIENPPPTGFIGSQPLGLFGSFPCDPAREAGFSYFPGFCGTLADFNYRVPVCNPLP